MSPDAKEIWLEAIKILGPAAITAIVGIVSAIIGYKVGKAQAEIRIKELDKNNEFKAREHIFDFYRERGNQLREKIGLVGKNLGDILGTLRALEGKDKELMLSFAADSIHHLVEAVPIDVELTKSELEENDMVDYLKFKYVEAFAQKLKGFKLSCPT